MQRDYFDTLFATDQPAIVWPAAFAILTAYATTGESWSDAENRVADDRLAATLRERGVWMERVTGYSPHTGHAEPGWAVALPFEAACDLGQQFRQDAIYYVQGDDLFVSHCDARRRRVPVGPYRLRLQPRTQGD